MAKEDDTKSKRRRFSDVGLKRLSGSKLDDLFKSPGMDFIGLKKRRKRHRTDEDSVSLHSVDLGNVAKDTQKKRRRSLSKLSASLVNILSPSRPMKKAVGQVGGALTYTPCIPKHLCEYRCGYEQTLGTKSTSFMRSLSLKNLMSPGSKNKDKIDKHPDTPYRRPGPATPKRRESQYWYQTVHDFDRENYDSCQIKRQEAIYEVFKGEDDLIQDLELVSGTYHDSMKKLGLMSEEELEMIFGHIETLVPLHQDLVDELKEQRMPDGTTEFVGQVLLDWAPKLETYITYCANQVFAKALLDFKKQDPAVEDFLERCQESPFSRKLDLWSFLDVPRSRLVKYPLLFKTILKYTPVEHCDYKLIEEANDMIDDIIKEVDSKAGEAKCKYTKEKLDYLDEKQKDSLIEESQAVLCDGILKNNRGTKLYVFLFEKILVLTRPATRSGKLKYQVYRQPMPVSEIVLEDDGEGKMGSFRSAFSNGQTVKHTFKVSFVDPSMGQSHTLQANDEHDRKQWVSALRSVIPERAPPAEEREAADGQCNGEMDVVDSSLAPPHRLTRASTSRTSLRTISSSSLHRQVSRGSIKRQISKGSLKAQASLCKIAHQPSRGSCRRFSIGSSRSKRVRHSGSGSPTGSISSSSSSASSPTSLTSAAANVSSISAPSLPTHALEQRQEAAGSPHNPSSGSASTSSSASSLPALEQRQEADGNVSPASC